MPEGPETHRQADRLRRALAGRPIRRIYFAFPQLRDPTLVGRCVAFVRARGKAMLIGFEGGPVLYTHNQLYGRWMIREPGAPLNTRRQLRVEIVNDRSAARLFSASTIELLAPEALGDHPFLGSLGPDPLDDDTSESEVVEWIRRDEFLRKRLGGLLLDQRFVAGVGNYLRSEILFEAKLSPRCRMTDLSTSTTLRLAQAIIDICRRSYRTGGITNDPELVADAKKKNKRRRDYRHFVFGRAGSPCPACGQTIQKSEVAGRRLYSCVGCQV